MLINERDKWKQNFQDNKMPDSVILIAYRKHRNTYGKKIPENFEVICAYILYLENIKKDNTETLNDKMIVKRDYWHDIFKDGQLPNSQILKDYRLYRNSENKRTTRLVEEICEYVIYLENL